MLLCLIILAYYGLLFVLLLDLGIIVFHAVLCLYIVPQIDQYTDQPHATAHELPACAELPANHHR